MNSSKKLISILLVVVMIAAIVTGCTKSQKSTASDGNKNTTSNEKTDYISQQKAKWHIGDNLTLNWYVDFSWWTWNKKWSEYPILKEISDITGVTPNITIPAADGEEKINLMIATDSLPDMLTMDYSGKNVEKLIKQGYLYSINELSEKYCPELKNEIHPDIWKSGAYEGDGKLYGFPSWFTTSEMAQKYGLGGTQTYMVRKDIYEELGSPDISTPEKLLSLLKAFKAKYPTMNGQNSIALSLNPNLWYKEVIRRSFGIREYYIDKAGKVLYNGKDPLYIEFVKYMNQLGREGLINQEELMKKQAQIDEDCSNRVFMALRTYWNLDGINKTLAKTNPNAKFVGISAMNAVPRERDNTKIFPKSSRSGWTTTLITKRCKDPKAAIKFARYMWSKDGNLLAIYGHEGEHYTLKGNEVTKLPKWDEQQKDLGIKSYEFFESGAVRCPPVFQNKDQENNYKYANQYVYDNTVLQYKMIPDPTSAEGIIQTQMQEIENKAWASIMFAESEQKAVATYKKMLEDIEKVGISKLEAWWQQRYEKNRKMFGDLPKIF